MAITRKFLKGMGLSDEQIDTIIEAHTDTVDGLKADLSKYKKDAEALPGVQKELDDLKAKGDDGWKDKHDKLQKDFNDYKSGIEAEKSKAAKEAAVRAYFESKHITGKNLDIAMRGSRSEIDGVELADGKIKDAAALDALVAGDFAGLVVKTGKRGADVPDPPGAGGTGGTAKTKEEILAIRDGAARRKAMAENPTLFGLPERK